MKVKVCGMREPENISELVKLPVDYIGFIFYPKSKRFVEQPIPILDFQGKEKVGVFVNATEEFILKKSREYNFITIQLHGNESPDFCQNLKFKNFKIIKAFSVADDFEFSKTIDYQPFCDYFLFDTKGKLPGGNGITFNWEILKKYEGDIPFFLSGGINISHIEAIKLLNIRKLYGLDLNSGFEIKPAKKDISLLKKFIEDVRKTS